MNKYSKMGNDELLNKFLLETYVYGVMPRKPTSLHKEILRRMACYQYAIKPLNKKLYKKVVINI